MLCTQKRSTRSAIEKLKCVCQSLLGLISYKTSEFVLLICKLLLYGSSLCCVFPDGALTLKDALIFCAGADGIPPCGFVPPPRLDSDDHNPSRFPLGKTCVITLILPAIHSDYSNFIATLEFGILNCQGFGHTRNHLSNFISNVRPKKLETS